MSDGPVGQEPDPDLSGVFFATPDGGVKPISELVNKLRSSAEGRMRAAPRQWADLDRIEVISGTAEDPDGSFRGFVTIRARASDGSFMAGQLDPDELRSLALNFLEVAEAADQDAMVFRVMTRNVGVPPSVAAHLVRDMRTAREEQRKKGDADAH